MKNYNLLLLTSLLLIVISCASQTEKEKDNEAALEMTKGQQTEKEADKLAPYRFDKGTWTDNRDGQTYNTLDVNGILWLAENFNYTTNSIGYKISEDCECGTLYTIEEVYKVVPEGWHIASKEEYEELVSSMPNKEEIFLFKRADNIGGAEHLGFNLSNCSVWWGSQWSGGGYYLKAEYLSCFDDKSSYMWVDGGSRINFVEKNHYFDSYDIYGDEGDEHLPMYYLRLVKDSDSLEEENPDEGMYESFGQKEDFCNCVEKVKQGDTSVVEECKELAGLWCFTDCNELENHECYKELVKLIGAFDY